MENIGISTFNELKICYIFCGSSMKSSIINKWLEDNKPKTDYWYYDKLWKLKRRLLNKYKPNILGV